MPYVRSYIVLPYTLLETASVKEVDGKDAAIVAAQEMANKNDLSYSVVTIVKFVTPQSAQHCSQRTGDSAQAEIVSSGAGGN